MTKLRKAIQLSFDEWNNQLENKFSEALLRSEIPFKSKEELKAEANRIWLLAHNLEKFKDSHI